MNQPQTERERLEAVDLAEKKKGFDQFISDPMVRMLMADIPESNGKLEGLLQACYNSGFGKGAGVATLEIMKTLVSRSRKPL